MLKVSFIGSGQRSFGYIKVIQKFFTKEISVICIYDIDSQRVKDFSKKVKNVLKLNIIPYYGEISKFFIANTDTDVIFICTPDNTHVDIVEKCVTHSNIKNIVLEKPTHISREQGIKLDSLVSKNNLNIFVPFVLRFSPFFQKIKELLPMIGAITRFDYKLDLSIPHSTSYYRRWHRHKEKCGSFLITKCCHDIDIVTWLNGDKESDSLAFANVRTFDKKDMGNCSSCDLDCRYRFDKNKAYVFMTDVDIEDPINFDRCIYNNDHDIYDHFTCMLNYKTYIATYSVIMFQEKGGRSILINGMDGKIEGCFRTNKIYLKLNGKHIKEIDMGTLISNSGHNGSDTHFIEEIVKNVGNNVNDHILYEESKKCIAKCLDLDLKVSYASYK